MVAAVTIPEFALADDEAEQLARALAEVEKHYRLNPLSEKHMAILGLVVVSGRIYGKRAAILLAPKGKPEPKAPAAPAPGAPAAPPPSVAPVVPAELGEAWLSVPAPVQ